MNNTLSNGFRLLEYLAETGEFHGVKALAETFELPNSHVCRLLKTLAETGHVEQDASRRYRVSLKILTLANARLRRLAIRNQLRPFLDRLRDELSRPVFLSVPFEWRPLIVDVVYPNGSVADPSLTIGGVNPVHASASGKVCAAYHPLDGLDEFLSGVEFTEMTSKTITDAEAFKKELAAIRSERLAVTNSERDEGVAAVAAPVFDRDGEFVAVIGTVLPVGRPAKDVWNRFKEKTRAAAESSSHALGYGLRG